MAPSSHQIPRGTPRGSPRGGLRGGSPGGSPRLLRGPSRGAILGPVCHPFGVERMHLRNSTFKMQLTAVFVKSFVNFNFELVIRSSYEHRVPAAADMLCTPTVQSTAWPRPPSHIYIVLHHLRPMICLHKRQYKDICIASTSYRSNVCFRRYSGPLWWFPESVAGCGQAYACNFFCFTDFLSKAGHGARFA